MNTQLFPTQEVQEGPINTGFTHEGAPNAIVDSSLPRKRAGIWHIFGFAQIREQTAAINTLRLQSKTTLLRAKANVNGHLGKPRESFPHVEGSTIGGHIQPL